MTYRTLNSIAAGMALALALGWLVLPAHYLLLWALPLTDAAAVMMRRGGVLFFTFAVLLFLTRDFRPGPERNIVCITVITGCVALAVQALYEIFAGYAGPGAWGAVAVEVTLASAYAWVQRRAVT